MGCTVSVRVAREDGQEETVQWLISRGKSRRQEGVLGRRTRLARALLGRHVGEILSPEETRADYWLRIEAIEMPVSGEEALSWEPATLYGLGGMSVRIGYEEGWTGPFPVEVPEALNQWESDDEPLPEGAGEGADSDEAGEFWDDGHPRRGGDYWDDADL